MRISCLGQFDSAVGLLDTYWHRILWFSTNRSPDCLCECKNSRPAPAAGLGCVKKTLLRSVIIYVSNDHFFIDANVAEWLRRQAQEVDLARVSGVILVGKPS